MLPVSFRKMKPLHATVWLVTAGLGPQVHESAEMAAETWLHPGCAHPRTVASGSSSCLIWNHGSQLPF